MQTFSLFIHDRRYSAPTLQFVVVKDQARALELARRELFASPEHLAVDVCDEQNRMVREERGG